MSRIDIKAAAKDYGNKFADSRKSTMRWTSSRRGRMRKPKPKGLKNDTQRTVVEIGARDRGHRSRTDCCRRLKSNQNHEGKVMKCNCCGGEIVGDIVRSEFLAGVTLCDKCAVNAFKMTLELLDSENPELATRIRQHVARGLHQQGIEKTPEEI